MVEEATAAPAPGPPPVRRPDSEHDLFGRLMDGVARDAEADWGFLIVRTAYADDDAGAGADARRWSRALARLRRLAGPGGGEGGGGDGALATPVMDCPATLQGASYSDVRRAFADWRARYLQNAGGGDDDDDDDDDRDGDGWPTAVRPDCCLVVDAEALGSLLADDDANDAAWVVVVDARDPRTVGYGGGGGPFAGWLRAAARALGGLDGDLAAGLGLAEDLCPPRAYLGQLLLYDVGRRPAVRRLDPPPGGPGGPGYYRFPGGPGGTVRGAAQAAPLLARILRDVGESVYE